MPDASMDLKDIKKLEEIAINLDTEAEKSAFLRLHSGQQYPERNNIHQKAIGLSG